MEPERKKKGRPMRRRGDHNRKRKSRDPDKYCRFQIIQLNKESFHVFRKLCELDPEIGNTNQGMKNLISQCLYDHNHVFSTKVRVPEGTLKYNIWAMPKKVKEEFKLYCRERGVSLSKMFGLLIEEMNHGDRTFKRKKRRHVHSFE